MYSTNGVETAGCSREWKRGSGEAESAGHSFRLALSCFLHLLGTGIKGMNTMLKERERKRKPLRPDLWLEYFLSLICMVWQGLRICIVAALSSWAIALATSIFFSVDYARSISREISTCIFINWHFAYYWNYYLFEIII